MWLTAEEVIALRQKLGMTQRDLAMRLHVTARTIRRWERGGTRASRYGTAALLALEERFDKGERV